MYLTLSGYPLEFLDPLEELAAEYVLQKCREVWVVTATRPYLAIDDDMLRAKMLGLSSFVQFSSATLFQNISAQDLKTRLASSLIGPGLTASLSSKSGILVEGEANPQAYVLQRWNPLLALGTHPFAAMGTHYIAAEPDRLFRREIGEFVAIEGEGRSEPRSEIQDFRKLADLVHRFHRARLGHSPSGNQALYAEMLDAIFVENEAALNAVARHHATAPREGPVYDYKASQLTRYGRLVHDDRGKPLIETSFALLHYEKALHEFDSLKLATTARKPRAQVHARGVLRGGHCSLHGVSREFFDVPCQGST